MSLIVNGRLNFDDPSIVAAIEENVRKAPPLTPEQLDRLALLFRSTGGGADA